MMKFLPKCLSAGVLVTALMAGGSAFAQTITASPSPVPSAGGTVSITYANPNPSVFGFTYFLQYPAELTVGACNTNANSLGTGSLVSCDTTTAGVVQINALNFAAPLEATAGTPAATIDFTSTAAGDTALTPDTVNSVCADQLGGTVAGCSFVVATGGGGITATISATDATAAEPADNGEFTVTLSAAAPAGLTINYTVAGTATNGTDYANLGGTVNIAAGATTATIAVTVTDDALTEGSETVIATLAAGTGYTVGTPASATVTIADDESPITPVPVLSVDSTTLTMTTTPGNTATQTATLTNTGTALLTYGALAVSGVDAANFAITGGTCNTAGGTLAVGVSCTIVVTFTAPATEGTSGAQIAITSDGGNVTIGLVGSSSLVSIPTLSEWAMIIMASLMLLLGAVTLRRNGYFK